jgi:hypothetical protein
MRLVDACLVRPFARLLAYQGPVTMNWIVAGLLVALGAASMPSAAVFGNSWRGTRPTSVA